jgi:hypothetical protein
MRPKQVFFYFMKTPSSSSSPAKLSDLKVLAIVGAIVAVLMFAVPILLGYIVFLKSTTLSGSETNDIVLREDEPLGEKGSRCGSNAHLPCRPGLICSATAPAVGVCNEDPGTPVVYPQLNAECDIVETPSCAPGLICEYTGGTAGTCKPSSSASPHVASVRLDGFQPVQGGYTGAPGDVASAQIQTVNAKSLSVMLVSGEKKEPLTATESDGGIWKVDVKMPSADAELVVTAVGGTSGMDRSSLVIHVAPTPEIR